MASQVPVRLQTGRPHFFMTEQQLKLALWQIRKEGFEESFTDYCARTCSSHTYPEEKFAAAKMHGFFLRYFIGAYLDDYFIDAEKLEGIESTVWEVGKKSIDETLQTENATAMSFCRAFVKNWCEAHSA